MESWQKDHIQRNLSSLLSNTIVNSLLLAELQTGGMLSRYDVENVEAERTNFDKARLLYRIMETRTKGYVELIKALRAAHQSGAGEILLTISTEMLSNLRVAYLGQTKPLNALLSNNQIDDIQHWVMSNISAEECLHMFENVFNEKEELILLRDTLPLPYTLYVPRLLSRRVSVNPKLFQMSCSDVFVFNNIKRPELRPFVKSYAIESSTSQLFKKKITVRFILLDKEAHWHKICEKHDSPIHLIRYEKVTQIFLVEATTGVSKEVRQHLNDKDVSNPECVSEDEFVDKHATGSDKGICICDVPGMGKSLLLANLARKFSKKHSDNIVAFFQLRNLMVPSGEISRDDAIETVLKCVSTCKLAECILHKIVESQETKFQLFFDALDEVEEGGLERTTSFLVDIRNKLPEARVYVTSRPVVREQLETSMGAIAYDIVGFNEETQQGYVVSCWLDNKLGNERMEKFARACLQGFRENLNPNEHDITGVPLQCKLIADVYADQAIIYADTKSENEVEVEQVVIKSLSEIYSKFMGRQLGEPQCNFKCMYKHDSFSCDAQCQVRSFHVWKSIKLVFPPTIVNKISETVAEFESISLKMVLSPGLLERRNEEAQSGGYLEFIHRTFAEFLAAEFLANAVFTTHITHEKQAFQQLVFNKIFTHWEKEGMTKSVLAFRLREQVVAYFLDAILAKKNSEDITILCRASLWPRSFFLSTLEGCMHSTSDKLLSVYFKASRNSRKALKIANKTYVSKHSEATDFLLEELENILRIGALIYSVDTVEKICKFFLDNFNINLVRLKYSSCDISPIHLAAARGDFELTQFFAESNAMLLDGVIYWCVHGTYFETQDLVEKKLDVAGMLVEKCPSLLTNPKKFGKFTNPVFADEVHLDAFKFLVDHNANFFETDTLGRTVLSIAIEYMSTDDFMDLCSILDGEEHGLNYFIDPKTLIRLFHEPFLNENKSKVLVYLLQYLGTKKSMVNIPEETVEGKSTGGGASSLDEILKTLMTPELYREHEEVFAFLFYAALLEHFVEIVEILLSFDSSFATMKMNMHNKPVPMVFAATNSEILKILVNGGANLFEVDTSGRTILHFLADMNQIDTFEDVVKYLGTLWEVSSNDLNPLGESFTLDADKPTNLTELFNWPTKDTKVTPLHCALTFFHQHNLDTLNVFLTGGTTSNARVVINVNATDKNGNTIVHRALERKCDLDVIKCLVKNDADFRIKNNEGCNLAHICAQENLPEHLKYFIELGIDVNEVDMNGNDALQRVIMNNRSLYYNSEFDEVHRALLGLNQTCKNSGKQTDKNVLKVEHKIAKKDIMKTAGNDFGWNIYFARIAYGVKTSEPDCIANVNTIDKYGYTALHAALHMRCNLEVINDLVFRGINFKLKDSNGCNVAHICAQKCLHEHLEYFMELGVDINELDSKGNTALQCGLATCSVKNYPELVKVLVTLVDAGDIITNVNIENKTAYDIAKESGHWCGSILEFLKSGSINNPDQSTEACNTEISTD